jgi:hypothetical protein
MANVCTRNAIDVPRCGVLWGLYTPPVSASGGWTSAYPSYEKAIGRRLDVIKRYVDWKQGVTFPDASDIRYAGGKSGGRRVLDFSWHAIDYTTRAGISYQAIANGAYDKSVILPEAARLKKFHHKVFIDFDSEQDNPVQAGRGTPAQYAAAYRHIHQVMQHAGVKNVIWAWVPTGYTLHEPQIKASWPGSAYVDWVGYDPYNQYTCNGTPWRSPYDVFAPFYQWLRQQPGMKNKPIMLGEYGSDPGPQIGSWYAGVPKALKRLPRIKAVMQWSSQTSAVCNFRLTDSAAAMKGFATASRSPYIMGLRH